MELILIRHGKAEEPSDMLRDERRRLTSDGRKKLQKNLPSLGLLLRGLDKAEIWTSPYDRAAQTAEIIAKVLAIDTVRPCDFIAEGDFERLITELSGVRPSATILAVGHEPSLGDWSRQLCGVVLPFKKGSAAAFHISSFEPLAAELQWFFQPQPLGRFGETLFQNSFRRP